MTDHSEIKAAPSPTTAQPEDYFQLLKPRVMSLVVFTAITVVGVAVFLVMLAEATIRRRKGVPNPWGEGATTLEWTLSSPPPHHQFNELPVVKDDDHH